MVKSLPSEMQEPMTEVDGKKEYTSMNVPDDGPMDIVDIQRILPHRYPFLLVDRILESDGNTRIIGLKNVTINEPFFQGHFPGHPIMPGVIQLEAIAQVAGLLLLQAKRWPDSFAYFMSMDKVKFRRPVVPGDCMYIEVTVMKYRASLARVRGEVRVDGSVVSEAELTLARVPQDSYLQR
ncbi:MAG: 3-hydroxyacyl-ACP dehydratase FabZ [Verrucomicrobiota bacterium]|jgi:UDP-3-O-[3-hydroxymyristoyl] N-acetylglucosamine deacetylase/3-hydroxyacyl-[acyl-carrier-protein] dehydratase|nr:3-hydroxyacyl-ACP dehydratase FabZ [Verrucomicrobiota bacterium]MDD8046830.1 3-hydroxyacyl-ACP dehydratase FabZ [Verrucomicrobiota bacterium]MDD8050663.1 3-hydroxyacyl-ACP dehydratase FabZ [Verrucomicrobiota bacterium]MDI9384371.1 3-hydroxyacyl-ACP dehydratase FabZ [Verrucomicrobiota bacterium]